MKMICFYLKQLKIFLGDFCKPCDCNGNIDVTDPDACNSETGVCEKCLENTYGDHCERCEPWFYGDAEQQTCQECECNRQGRLFKAIF